MLESPWPNDLISRDIRGNTQRKKGGITRGLEWEPLESAATILSTSKWVAASVSKSPTASTVHHIEEDVRIDIDPVHTTHTSHTAERRATASKHLRRVKQIVSIIVCGTLSVRLLAICMQYSHT